jgi:hypothetical protein
MNTNPKKMRLNMKHNVFYGIFTAESPINHQADEKMETTSICRSNTAITADGKEVKIYNISANAFRNVIRRHAADRLLTLLDLSPIAIPEIANVILYSGGPRLDKTAKSRGDGKEKKKKPIGLPLEYSYAVCQWFPMLELLGNTTQFCFIPVEGSHLAPTSLNALTPETAQFGIEQTVLSHHGIDVASLPDVVTEFQFNSKHDPRVKHEQTADSQTNCECGEVANIFEVQYLCKGTRLAHQAYIADRDDGMLSSCLSSALQEWQRQGGFIAGKKAQGAGVVSWQYLPVLPSPEKYEAFITAQKSILKGMVEDREIWKSEEAFFKHCK